DGRVPDDVWTEFPRVCGTFGEREGWHPCQMPETLLARIIRVCSNPGDLVLDPFAGSGTTLVVAKKLSRDFFGTDISKAYVKNIDARLNATQSFADIVGERQGPWPKEHIQLLSAAYIEFSIPTDRLFRHQHLLLRFAQRFNLRLKHSGITQEYTPDEVWIHLERIRKSGKLGKIRVHAEESTKTAARDPVEYKK
ncbi:MAG: site-specific DNA-methyltransferase, partial [Pirellulales bacterium]|nr:site-specific DNA-methyltransferase [Pirellulales bacterium]